MAYKSGADINAGIKQGSTYGTAVAIGAGDKIILENISDTRSVTVGESNAIGSGRTMDSTSDALDTEHTVNISQQARYDDGGLPLVMAAFLGASAAPAEQNGGEGDYLHRLTWDGTADKFLTVAREATTTETFEFPSCYVNSITIESGNTPGYLTYTADMIANNRVIDSSTNTNATLQAATELGTSIVAHQTSDYIWFNSQAGGALSSGDALDCVSSVSITYARPKRIAKCFGTTKILNTDKFVVNLTLNFDTLDDLTHFTNHHDGTEHKALFSIQGDQIGSGDNKSLNFYFPRLKAVESPEQSISDPGANGYSVTYKALVASSNPTGMNSTYPYLDVINENTSAILS